MKSIQEKEAELQEISTRIYQEMSDMGHDFDVWEPISPYKLQAKCAKCGGVVTIDVSSKIQGVIRDPFISHDQCPDHNPALMKSIEREYSTPLARVYRLLLSKTVKKERESE